MAEAFCQRHGLQAPVEPPPRSAEQTAGAP